MNKNLLSDRWKNPYLLLLGIIILSAIPFPIVDHLHKSLSSEIDRSSYLLFHNITEFFSIVVSLSIFGVCWFTYERSKDNHSLFLGTSFLAIGLLDFMHTLAYSGMSDLVTPNSANKSTQFWLVARFFNASIFLASAFIYSKNRHSWLTKANLLLAVLCFVGATFVAIIFFPSYLPATSIDGIGLTQFKKVGEYTIILILSFATIAYWKRWLQTGESVILYYLAAFILCIFGESVLSVYHSVFDEYNVLGHIYKVLSFCIIYKGTFVTSINRPYDQIIETNLKLQEKMLEQERAEEKILQSLREKETLIRELYHRTKNTLQIVRSMIVLQAADFPTNEELQVVVKKTEDRIQAISLVHQMLYATQDLSRISVKQYINQLFSLILDSFAVPKGKVTLNEDVEDRFFLIDTIIPIGLILNELITNSLKYAFPRERNGIINISLSQGGPQQNFSLHYSDNGIGFPEDFDFRNQYTLGLKLVYGIGELQMQGRVVINNDKGFNFLLEFPDNLYRARV
ncbi:histidine kinase [Leptospira fainei serovar Hurstbridge str. BUT 6]|uniref:histidine kinase n=1 Tax=Leptospira fainei serovar Hurstbridge str. BUT 6 TaxID=1193011 RepID=S3V3W9_9LEPT|nr:MASE3 domain-containing protein [Leptospira fainei]EPG75344.1 histidine kinase [Leptospira fainei serovar Hurstbridge str. BUT 6]